MVTARIAAAPVLVVPLDEAAMASKEWKKKNITDEWPLLETEHGNITEAVAICKYLARLKPNVGLLGATPLQ